MSGSDLHHPYVFVGLGNPGKQYADTRHNLGFLVIENLAQKWGWSWKNDRYMQAKIAKGCVEGRDVHLLLPQTYMNLSGQAVRRYLDFLKLPVQSVVIVVDDVALPFGQVRLKTMGSAGGHNGLKSIEASLGTTHYVRLRMGVGQPLTLNDLVDYVLAPFTASEQEELNEFIADGVDVLQQLIRSSPATLMNAVNGKYKRFNQIPQKGEENKKDESS